MFSCHGNSGVFRAKFALPAIWPQYYVEYRPSSYRTYDLTLSSYKEQSHLIHATDFIFFSRLLCCFGSLHASELTSKPAFHFAHSILSSKSEIRPDKFQSTTPHGSRNWDNFTLVSTRIRHPRPGCFQVD